MEQQKVLIVTGEWAGSCRQSRGGWMAPPAEYEDQDWRAAEDGQDVVTLQQDKPLGHP